MADAVEAVKLLPDYDGRNSHLFQHRYMQLGKHRSEEYYTVYSVASEKFEGRDLSAVIVGCIYQ